MGSIEQSDPIEEFLKPETPKQLSTEKCDSLIPTGQMLTAEPATGCDEQQTPMNETLSGLEAPKDMETYSFEECGSLVIEHPALDSVLGPLRENTETLDESVFERQCCLIMNSPVRSGEPLVDECVLIDQDAVAESCRVNAEYRADAINCSSALASDPEYDKFLEVECGVNQMFLNDLKDEAFVSDLKPVAFSQLASQRRSLSSAATGVKEDGMFPLYNNINLSEEGIKKSVMDVNDATKTLHVGTRERFPLFPKQNYEKLSNSVKQVDFLQCCDTEMVVGSGSTSDTAREDSKPNGILQGNNPVAVADISIFNICDAEAMQSNEALSSFRRNSREKKFEKESNRNYTRKKAINKIVDLLSAAVRRKRSCVKRSVRVSAWGLIDSLSKYIKLNAGAVDHRLGIIKSGGKSRKKEKVHVDATSNVPNSKSRNHASSGQVSLRLKLVRKGKNAIESAPLIGADFQEKISIGSNDKQLDLSKGIKDVTQQSSNKSLDYISGGNDLLDKEVQRLPDSRNSNSSASPDSEVIHVLNSQPAHKELEVHHNSTQTPLHNRPPAMPKMRKKKDNKDKKVQLGDSDVQNRCLSSSIIEKTEIPENYGDKGAKDIVDGRLGILHESAEAKGNKKSKGLKLKEKTEIKSKPVSTTTLKNGTSRKVKDDKWKLMGKSSIGENGISDFAHRKEDGQEASGKLVMDGSGDTTDIAMRGSANEDLTSLPAVPASAVQQISHPWTAWVCCDDCVKWRCIPANLADIIDETNCRWTCKDNQDKAFADCSIPQEKSNAEINADLNISGDEDGCGVHLGGKYHSTKQSAVPQQSSWMLIKSNIFLHRSRNSQTLDEIMVCHCKFSRDGKLGCGDECLNRMLNIECVQGACPCGDLCSNQQFQRQSYANLKWFRSGKKGYGLQVLEDIAEGKFLIEYVGEVLDLPTYEARQRVYASKGHKHFYFMTLNGNEVIDACTKGNLGRFINHSCDPNCRTEKWMVNGEICIGLFAVRDIKKGEELTFDYNYVRVFGAAAKKCYCGTPQCRGYIGGDRLDNELVLQSDSDEEFPEPVVLYENGEIVDVKTMMSESSSLDVVKDWKDDSVLRTEADITTKLEDSLSCVVGQLDKENVDKTRLDIQQESPSNRIVVSMTSPMRSDSPSLKVSLNKPVDAEDNRSATATQSKDRPRMKISRPSKFGKGKESIECGSGVTKSHTTPTKLKKLLESPAKHHLETVEEKLNELLDDAGGICKRKDAFKGYLKLLVLTAASGDCNHHEAIQSNKDLSMILEAILKTKSRTVLTDILNKNGLQMLHSMVKKCRGNFNMIPILRKLLKVFEFLAERKILNLEHINGDPPRPGVESFRESILNLTEHEDWKVHQIARNFRDKWIPRPLKKFNSMERASNCSRLVDSDMLEGPSNMVPSTRETRKRKSRWDQSPENIEEDAPPGFSCPGPLKGSSQIPLGYSQERFNSCLPVAYGIPFNYVQEFGTPQASTFEQWVIAPGMPFRPFPPLPLERHRKAPSASNGSHLQQNRGACSVQRRPFKQRRNCFRKPPWGFNRNGDGSGRNFARRPPGVAMVNDRSEHPHPGNVNNFMA